MLILGNTPTPPLPPDFALDTAVFARAFSLVSSLERRHEDCFRCGGASARGKPRRQIHRHCGIFIPSYPRAGVEASGM